MISKKKKGKKKSIPCIENSHTQYLVLTNAECNAQHKAQWDLPANVVQYQRLVPPILVTAQDHADCQGVGLAWALSFEWSLCAESAADRNSLQDSAD